MEDKKDILETLAGVTKATPEAKKQEHVVNTAQYYCDALMDENINNVLGNYDTHLITLVGFSEVGKSTFVASLYHQFMGAGEIDGYQFVDSDTYVGFERRAYIRNEAFRTSKRNARTSQIEGQFLTLCLYKNKFKKLIISDRAGEMYKNNYTSNLDDVKKDKGLINSPHVIFFIDSASLNDEDKYSDFNEDFQTLLSRMYSAGVFQNQKRIDVIYNKIDLNQTEEQKDLFQKQREELEKMMYDEYHISISNKFEVISNNMLDKGLKDTFKYLVNTLEEENPFQFDETNWVKTLLKELN